MRRLSFFLPVPAFMLALTVTAWADPPSTTVLTGTTIRCDSSESEGHPSSIQWVVIPPDGSTPTKPDSTEPVFDLLVSTPGQWLINLDLGYEHLVDGSPWSSHTESLIEAKSVVANLDPGPLQVTVNDLISLNGSASQISVLASASASFSVDGEDIDGCSFPAPVTDPSTLACNLPAADLGAGTFAIALVITDSISGSIDTDEAELVIIEEPPFTVDFSSDPSGSNPLTLLVELMLSEGWTYTDLESAVWEFGDSSPPETVICSSFNYYCQLWSHDYSADGYYDITVTATTEGGHSDSVTHEVMVGDPPPLPTAEFTATPGTATVNSPIAFNFTGSCSDVCAYLWDFGDGTTSSLLNPSHTFITPVDRLVSLTVTNPSGQDETNQMLSVSNCWSPTGGISQTGSCYGAPIGLQAPPADTVVWSTGATSFATTVAAPGLYWAHVRQGSNCWAYVEYIVALDQCQGTPFGNVNMDAEGTVDAADLKAHLLELSDGDGELVIDSWAGELGAPGADLVGDSGPDGLITTDDLVRLIEVLFSEE